MLEKKALGVGYGFSIFEEDEINGIELKGSGQFVKIDGESYEIQIGTTFKESQKVDALLDSDGEYLISDYKVSKVVEPMRNKRTEMSM